MLLEMVLACMRACASKASKFSADLDDGRLTSVPVAAHAHAVHAGALARAHRTVVPQLREQRRVGREALQVRRHRRLWVRKCGVGPFSVFKRSAVFFARNKKEMRAVRKKKCQRAVGMRRKHRAVLVRASSSWLASDNVIIGNNFLFSWIESCCAVPTSS